MGTRDGTPPGGSEEEKGLRQGETAPPTPDAEDLAALIGQAEALDALVERMRAGRAPLHAAGTPPSDVSPQVTELLPTAALLRAAAPEATEPRPAFVAALRARLEQGEAPRAMVAAPPQRRGISRRGLLWRGAGVAAAAAAVGIAGGAAIERVAQGGAPAKETEWSQPLVAAGTWTSVASAAAVPVGGVQRFTTESVVGYLRRTSAGFEALSAACTHMGCLVAWNAGARSFDCPCHGGRFREDGTAHPASTVAYRPLPHIQTKVEAGQVWVYVPSDPSPDTPGTPDPKPGYRGSNFEQ